MRRAGIAHAKMHRRPMRAGDEALTRRRVYAAVETATEEWMAAGIRRAAVGHARLLVVRAYARSAGVAKVLGRA